MTVPRGRSAVEHLISLLDIQETSRAVVFVSACAGEESVHPWKSNGAKVRQTRK